jgi:hypothetical protein
MSCSIRDTSPWDFSIMTLLLTKTHETNEEKEFGQIMVGVFYAVVNIIFVLWTILVAKSARREIKDGVE